MSQKLLIIDDAAHFRILIRHMLKSCRPDIILDEYDPVAKGHPDEHFPWGDYDILLLDYNLGNENGLDWYQEFSSAVDFPSTIMFTGEGSESIAVKTLKMGVNDYLPKEGITPQALQASIEEVLEQRLAETGTTTLQLTTDQTLEASPVLAHTLMLHPNALPGYTILERLGNGASSTVYLACNSKQEKVVLKVFDPGRDSKQNMLERFLEEHRIISTIKKRHVVTIYEQGITDDFCFIAMEYFPNGDLRSKIKQGIRTMQALNYLLQITRALHTIHKKGIIHRDIKPENLMLRADGTLVLVDFGIAKQLEVESGLTSQGEIYGTPHYISPEQIRGRRPDARSDLYSLGVVLYEMLSKRRPFEADSLPNLFYQQTHVTPPALSTPLPFLEEITFKLLKTNPAERFQSAAELMQTLEARWSKWGKENDKLAS